ncbi:MAG: RES family NAD+ phosphorylase [Candidatus Competibacteraceae bacterium]|nr:RES family NAD+ phosphorylase [Candidatus Competibacteraceae bacterium]
MASSLVHDPKILDVLSTLDVASLETQVYRAVFQGRDPTVGSLAGGRWSPPQTFEALYTSFEPQCAIAEVHFHLNRQPVFPSRPVELHTLGIVTQRTIDVSTDKAMNALGLNEKVLTSLDYTPCQDIGHAAEFLGFDSLCVRSARCSANNMVIIVGHLASVIEPKSFRVIDWSEAQ